VKYQLIEKLPNTIIVIPWNCMAAYQGIFTDENINIPKEGVVIQFWSTTVQNFSGNKF
jgi:hypothetical protein